MEAGKVGHRVLDGVTRLANIYIKICASGSILFRDWVSTFYCEPGRKVNAVIDFGLSNQMLRGFSEHRPTVALQIHAVCEFFDECYTDWMHHIEVQRKQFYNLNHYTTQQVVILCKKIASFCFTDDDNIDPLVYPMLCAVKPNCTKDDLGMAVKSAFKDLAEQEKHAMGGGIIGDDSPSTVATKVSEPEQTDVKERQDFINAMKDADFPEELAKRALHEIPATDIDEGLVWCMDHMGDAFSSEDEANEDVEENYDSVSHEDDTRTPIELLNVTESFQSVAGELLRRLKTIKGSLEFKLKELWTSHLQSAATSVTDYLSVEHLGCIMEELTDLGEINRPLPQQLVKGSLNLMVCPQADILRAVLSLYLCGQNLPLPGSDEVLLCTEHTTAEESPESVQLFNVLRQVVPQYGCVSAETTFAVSPWHRLTCCTRRAANDRQGKIYCLANADLLDYEVSEKAESYLEKHIKGNQVCCLVVICSKEREDRSRLVTALDKHRINTPIIATVKDVQAYLKKHFQMTCVQRDRLHVAAEVDPEHCSIRVVKSERAGVGKSLCIRRLTEELTALNGASLYCNHKSPACVSVTLQQKRADHSDVVRTLVEYTTAPNRPIPRVFHFDIAHETYEGIDNLLFNLLVLGSLTDQTGLVWRKSQMDLYVIETLPLLWHGATTQNLAGPQGEQTEYVHRILALLPSLTCRSPQQSIDALTQQGSPALLFSDWSKHDQLMDEKEFHSAVFQRPFQYLTRFSSGQCLNSVAPQCPEGTPAECLQCLLR
ncbi:hypothetical protein LSAT2_021672 [Lamellibrachia satsuma]|nr:hypothetical protein LSAT2_021672 [Lamellibrachia satsuma]